MCTCRWSMSEGKCVQFIGLALLFFLVIIWGFAQLMNKKINLNDQVIVGQ